MIAWGSERAPGDALLSLTGRDYLSFSSISLYRRCPLAWRFRYVDHLPEDRIRSSLAFGGAIHAAIEHWFRGTLAGELEPGVDELLEAFWAAWHDRQEGAQIDYAQAENASTIHSLASRVLEAFVASGIARPAGTVIGVEEELRGPVIPGVPDLLARIDLLVETDERLIVVDFKTARCSWGPTSAEEQAEQLLLYAALVERLVPEKPLQLQYVVLTKAKSPAVQVVTVPADAQRIGRTLRTVRSIWQAMQAGHVYPVPSPACRWCPYRQPCRDWLG